MIAYVEPHGRAETAAEIGDLEVIPRRHVLYRGVLVPEMDLDAVLRRRPQVAIVDELPHTNTPGASPHETRWQRADEVVAVDVSPEDLLDRLRAGKVYPPEKIERALAHFFRREHLASLREIALREVADAAARRRPATEATPPAASTPGAPRR